MVSEKFDDVIDLNHPWVTELRLPIVDGWGAMWSYPVALGLPVDDYNLWDLVVPTEDEAQMLSSYNAMRSTFWYDQWYIDQVVRAGVLDLDPGVNTMTFGKHAKNGWMYKMRTWETGPWPYFNVEQRYDNLIDLLDRVERYDANVEPVGQFAKKYAEWRQAQNI